MWWLLFKLFNYIGAKSRYAIEADHLHAATLWDLILHLYLSDHTECMCVWAPTHKWANMHTYICTRAHRAINATKVECAANGWITYCHNDLLWCWLSEETYFRLAAQGVWKHPVMLPFFLSLFTDVRTKDGGITLLLLDLKSDCHLDLWFAWRFHLNPDRCIKIWRADW